MPELKRVVIDLPSDLIDEVFKYASKYNLTPNEIVRIAIQHYIEDKEKDELTEQMIRGYQEMSEINLQIAEEFIYSDNEALQTYETENK